MPDPDDDLLRPTLAADFDVRRFEQPWNPASMPFAAFFVGPLGTGWLYALNYRYLGLPKHARNCALLAVGIAFACALVLVWAISNKRMPTDSRWIRYGSQGFSVAVGLWLTSHQMGRFRAWQKLGRPARPLLLVAFQVFFLSWLGFAGLAVVAWLLLDLLSLLPGRP